MRELISLVENYIKLNHYNYNDFIDIFIYWWIFIITVLFLKWIYEYMIDSVLLFSYNNIYMENAEKFLYMSYNDFLEKKQWSTFKVFDRWMEYWYFFMEQLLNRLLESLFWILIIVSILFYVDYRMAMITLAMVPVMIYLWVFVNKKTNYIQENINEIREKAYWTFWDAIWNIWLIKTLTLENRFIKKLNKWLNKAYNKQIKVTKRWVAANIYTGFLVMISRFLVLWLGIYFLVNWSLTFATLFLFFSYIWYIYFPLSFIFWNLKNIQKQLTWVSRFYEQLDKLLIDKDINSKIKLSKTKWGIHFNNVWFDYWDWKKILNKISFNINSWEKIAFVWNTWAWKSTIINLLFRFWEINSWEITIDGINIKDISKLSLRKKIWIVMQDNSLFNTTIKENLLFANKDASTNDIENAIKKAEANFVFKLDKWINTVIWERWLKLSWWEKQRLAIARLFLKNPKILVLDEATSALDNKTERLVQKALDRLMKWRTSIVIAHRLSTIKNADKIFMIENWKIIEEWNYSELINKNWKFYELANPEHLILN